jgi:serine/threonine-protein kinase
MAKNPANRYQSAEEMRADLERVRRGLPVEATPVLPVAAATQAIGREPAPTAVIPPPEPERSRWWIPVLVTLLILGVLAAVLFVLAQNLLNDDEQTGLVPVPDVVGERLNTARSILEDAGFVVPDENVIRVPAPAEDPEAEPGTVLEQDPAADTEAEEGSTVTLTVVAEPDAVVIPTGLAGQDPDEVRLQLEALGLVVGPIQQEPSAEFDEGQVTRIEPPEGSEVQPGDTVTIFVSTGPELVTVPDVTCLSVGEAGNQLRAAGLIPSLSSDRVPTNPFCRNPNKVAAQSPAANSQATAGDTVTLFQGEEPSTGPTGPTFPTGPTGPTA